MQYLNGINVQYLDGLSRIARPEVVQMYRDSETSRLCGFVDNIASARKAYNQRQNVEAISEGVDLLAYSGLNGTDDSEMLRNYIVRTKEVVDEAPAIIQAYRNPQQFVEMLNYVIKYWDTAQRENACKIMAEQEQRLIRNGDVKTPTDDSDDMFGGGFFVTLYAAIKPQSEIALACQDILSYYKAQMREAAALAREEGKMVNGLSGTYINKGHMYGLCGEVNENRSSALLYGYDLTEHAMGDVEFDEDAYNYNYLGMLHDAIAENESAYFADKRQSQAALHGLGSILDNWDNEVQRDIALDRASYQYDGQLNGLFKKLKKAIKKVGKGIKKAAKAVGKATKKVVKATIVKPTKAIVKATGKAAKAVGKAVKAVVKYTIVKPTKAIVKAIKKVVKFIIRYNPITLAIRGILLLACRKNWFNLSKRCYPGSMTQADAISQLKITADTWKKSKEAYDKFKKRFTNLGGKESKLSAAMKKGYTKIAVGAEDPKAVTKSFIQKNKTAADDKEIEAEIAAEEKAMKASGATLTQVTDKGDEYYEEVKTTVAQTQNVVTTTAATNFYEDCNDTTKIKYSIPKNTALLYDNTYSNNDYYRVSYKNINGYISKKNAKIGGTLSGVDENIIGLGILATTVAAISSCVSILSALVAAIAKIFGKDKLAAVATGVSAATAAVAAGASLVASSQANKSTESTGSSSQPVETNISSPKNSNTFADKLNNASNYVAQGAEIATNLTTSLISAKNSVNEAKNGNVYTPLDNTTNATQTQQQTTTTQVTPTQVTPTQTALNTDVASTNSVSTSQAGMSKIAIVALLVGGLGLAATQLMKKNN